MADVMIASLPIEEASSALAEIDDDCEAATLERADLALDIRRGPFGAFLLESSRSTNRESTIEPFDDLVFDDWDATVTDSLRISQTFGLDKDTSYWDCLARSIGAMEKPQEVSCSADMHQGLNFDDTWSEIPLSSSPLAMTPSMHGAPVLLKHYADSLIPSLTPFRHTKTPWHILFLPDAMITMTAITIGNEVDNASLTNLYGILAISALDLHHRSLSQKWDNIASDFRSHAQAHVTKVLERAFDLPKSLKYKTAILALLTMVQLSVCLFTRLQGLADPCSSLMGHGTRPNSSF